MKKSQNNWWKIILSLLLASMLFVLSHPNYFFPDGLSFFAWICFAPVFWAVHKSSLKSAWLYGFFYGAISYAGLCYWLYNYSEFIFVLAVLFCGFCYAILFEILKLTDFIFQKGGLQKKSWIPFCVILISFEFIKTKGFLGFSYGVIGYTQWKNIALIQIANVLGVYGVSALVIFASGILYGILILFELKKDFQSALETETYHTAYSPVDFAAKIEKQRKKTLFGHFWIFILIFALLICASLLYGTFTKFQYDKSDKIKIAAIQHNENSREDGIENYAANIRKLTSLTNEAIDLNPDIDLVVWPETAVVPSIMYQYYFGKDRNRVKLVDAILEYINNMNQTFVIGNFHKTETGDYNSALVFTPKKNVIPPKPESYFKMHLVPISEEFPYKEKFPKIASMLENFGVTFWEKGTEYKVFQDDENDFCFSTLICFENTFPEIAREMYENGSRCLISLTNDSWAKSAAAQNQHLSMAVFRSVENKIPGVISATTGATCVISPEGRIIKIANPFMETYCVAEIPIVSKSRSATIYTEFGDALGNVFVIISFVLLIIGLINCIIKICQSR